MTCTGTWYTTILLLTLVDQREPVAEPYPKGQTDAMLKHEVRLHKAGISAAHQLEHLRVMHDAMPHKFPEPANSDIRAASKLEVRATSSLTLA